jgi:two-component system nitrogen regulation sensor histidine kinase NtrY
VDAPAGDSLISADLAVREGETTSPPSPAGDWTWWAAAAGLGLLIAGQWIHAPRVEYLVLLAVATAAAVASVVRTRGPQRRWTAACTIFLIVASAFAIPAQRSLWRIQHDWDAWRRNTAIRGLATLRAALDDAVASSVRAAAAAARAPNDRTRAFELLSPLVRGHDENGVVLYHGATPFAWAGTVRSPVDLTYEGPTIVATQFYLALQVVQRGDGEVRTVAVTLLDALPPADRLSAPLARRVAADAGLSGFNFAPVNDSAGGPEVLHYAVANLPLFDVRAAPLIQGEVSQQILERVRMRVGLAVALALICFVIGVWRGTRMLSRRVGALTVGLACTALIPLNQFSNLTRLYDPSIYFTPNGGPFTANAGALATTSAIVLLGILAVFRRQGRRASRWGAIATILLVAGLGPFLLRELARGVQVPLHGVDGALWLIWEIPLFLAAVSVLLAGAATGAAALGPRRG